MKQILLIGLGGGIGSALRYMTSAFVTKFYDYLFPLGTFLVNILGCFLLGLLLGVIGFNFHEKESLRFFFITGLCGGYTTFSTFTLESLQLIQNESYLLALTYFSLSIILGVLAIWLGMELFPKGF